MKLCLTGRSFRTGKWCGYKGGAEGLWPSGGFSYHHYPGLGVLWSTELHEQSGSLWSLLNASCHLPRSWPGIGMRVSSAQWLLSQFYGQTVEVHVLACGEAASCAQTETWTLLFALEQWFPTFLMLWLLNTVPHAVTPTIQLSCCYFITMILLLLWVIILYNIYVIIIISDKQDMWYSAPVKRLFDPQKGLYHRFQTTALECSYPREWESWESGFICFGFGAGNW